MAVQTHSRSDDLGELLPYILGHCGHEPQPGDDGIAVCDTCANVLTVLVDRYDEPDAPLH